MKRAAALVCVQLWRIVWTSEREGAGLHAPEAQLRLSDAVTIRYDPYLRPLHIVENLDCPSCQARL